MHIPDGFVPPSVSIAGYAITGGVTWYSLRQISRERNPQEKIPKASLLTAAFFVASLIHIPIPPTSIHLVLNGIMGAILGYYAFPAIAIGLFFQAALFQHGGLSTLGINAVVMGIPALLAYHLFQLRDPALRVLPHRFSTQQQKRWTKILAFGAGAGALGLSAIIFTVVIITNLSPDIDAQTERNAIYLSLIGYGIQAVLEGIFTVMLISFIEKVKPELLK
ncbi:cobalt transporter CbiM [Pleurocapsales cyanobacterium LEGE 06147]|nr:cobalt transporter CbiM [Pleurocapsales cyanobacterium LEGE 06147]